MLIISQLADQKTKHLLIHQRSKRKRVLLFVLEQGRKGILCILSFPSNVRVYMDPQKELDDVSI